MTQVKKAGSSLQDLGRKGEQLACQILEEKGYRVIDRNWRCRYGEIDIICFDPHLQTLIFVEVKTRRTPAYGGAKAAISTQKYLRMRRLTGLWLDAQDRQRLPVYRQIRLDTKE